MARKPEAEVVVRHTWDCRPDLIGSAQARGIRRGLARGMEEWLEGRAE